MASAPIPVVYIGIESGRAGAESPESQLRAIAKHPPATEGRVCVGTFKESGKTGYKGERGPELERAIAAAKDAAAEQGQAELWVYHSSRAARGDGTKGRRSLLKLYADLLYEGVTLRSVTDDEFLVNPMLVGIASVQANKYSADLSAHVKRGKDEQRAKGERPGGPLPDGYTMRVLKRDAKGKVTKREFDFNPTRQPTVARMFELLLQGIPDARVGRILNEEGHRTERGGYWNRRTVADKARNPWFAGAVVWFRESEREEIIWDPPTPHPAYIAREDFERLASMRVTRDKGRGSNRKPGRPNERHLLAHLAVCERCGGKMRASTASYRRKDGTKNYSYVCENVHAGNGACDAPTVNGEVADLELASYLDELFVNGGYFMEKLNLSRSTEREETEAAREREGKRFARLEKKATALRQRYGDLLADGEDDRAAVAEATLAEVRAEVEQAEHRIGELDAILAAEPDPVDRALDIWTAVKEQVRDALGRAGVPEIRRGLAETFECFAIDTTPDGVKVKAFLAMPEVLSVERIGEPQPVGKRTDSQSLDPFPSGLPALVYAAPPSTQTPPQLRREVCA